MTNDTFWLIMSAVFVALVVFLSLPNEADRRRTEWIHQISEQSKREQKKPL